MTTIERLSELAPWHFSIDIGGGVNTTDGNQARFGDRKKWPVGVVNPNEIAPLLKQIYPNGLQGKRFLDVACNGGGYSVTAKRLGAAYALGFDAREHWINQATFVARHLGMTGIEFKTADVGAFTTPEHFDISLFKGIFYHLPDPVHALRQIADVTRELIIVDTETGGERGELSMVLKVEDRENLMTGVDGIAWWPSGPDLIERILKWMGFPATKEIFWRSKPNESGARSGRCRVVGARSPALLQGIDTEALLALEPKRKKALKAAAAAAAASTAS